VQRGEAQRGQPAGAGAAAPESTRPAAESTAATAPVAKGTLRVRTEPPYAEIFVDGDSVGVGSAFDIAIAAGVRHLKVTAPSYATFDTTFSVTPGRLSNLGTIKLQVGP
jgi:hypothetical protein